MNSYLKEIDSRRLRNKKEINDTYSRHTCTTVVMLTNHVSLENVAKILGHSNIKTTQHYVKVLDYSILRDIKNVESNFSGMVK